MTALTRPLKRPLTFADVPRAINRCVILVALVLFTFGKEYSLEWLEENLRRCLCEGGKNIVIKAVEAADKKDDRVADAALRDVGSELMTALATGRVQSQDLTSGHLQIITYFDRVKNRAPLTRKPGGHEWYDDWQRDIGLCILIRLINLVFGVQKTRSLDSRPGPNRKPSAISILTEALAHPALVRLARGQANIDISEKTIQQHLWYGLPGELVRQVVPDEKLIEMLRAAM